MVTMIIQISCKLAKIWRSCRAPFQEVPRKTWRLLLPLDALKIYHKMRTYMLFYSIKFGQHDSRSKIKQLSCELFAAFHKAISDFAQCKQAPANRQRIIKSPRLCARLLHSCFVVYSTNTTPQCQMLCYRRSSSVVIHGYPNEYQMLQCRTQSSNSFKHVSWIRDRFESTGEPTHGHER